MKTILKRVRQAYSKFFFCLHIAGDGKTFFRLLINSKRLHRFGIDRAGAALKKKRAPVKYTISYKGEKNTIYLRTYAGDIKMFYEVFWERAYELPPSFPHVNGVIVDAGANIGMSALYFSICFPNASIYCIEPATGNFNLVKKNLRNQIDKGSIQVQQAALYSENGFARISEQGWAYNAMLDESGEQTVKAITMDSFFENNQLTEIDLLKIDIEGAEQLIFQSPTAWLQKVNALIIEIHSPKILEEIKGILVKAGFYFHNWSRPGSYSDIYIASRKDFGDSAGRLVS